MSPKKIKLIDKNKLFIQWDEDSESTIPLKYLRDECPCATCKGETVLLKTYRPARPAHSVPGMYEIKDIQQVGGYAIQITWRDGHNTGIYSWEYLRKLDNDQQSGSSQNYKPLL